MTVASQNLYQYYSGPITIGSVLPINEFTFIANSHVAIKVRNEDVNWIYGTDYTVTGEGTLIRSITVLKEVQADETLVAFLNVPITQEINPEEGGNFPAVIQSMTLDKLTYICQMLSEKITRSIQASIDTLFDGTVYSPVDNIGKALIINSTGTGIDYSDANLLNIVSDVEDIATAASESATAANESATAANESATAAINAAVTINMPTPVALSYLRQKTEADGFEYRTPAQVLDDIAGEAKIQTVTCSTAGATAIKEITIPNADFTQDFLFFAKFENANTSATIQLKANDGTAYDIYSLKASQITGAMFSNTANESSLFKWDSVNSRYVVISGCPNRTVIETYSSGSNWYRIWSDGFIEQGGIYDNGSNVNAFSATITYLKQFVNSPVITGLPNGADHKDVSLVSWTNAGFVALVSSNYGTGVTGRYLHWEARGY